MNVDGTWPPKRPDTERPYGIDLSTYLPSTSVPTAASFTVPSGLVLFNGQQGVVASGAVKYAYVWLASGLAGATYDVVAQVTTNDGMSLNFLYQLPMSC